MAIALTTRLQLQKPDDTELMNLGDDILSANYDKIDLNAHQRIVANTSDIVTPYEGESIYATVPVHNYVRKSGAWVQVDGTPPPATGGSRGFKGENDFSSQQTVSTGLVDVLVLSITFTAEAGRRYLMHYNFNAVREATNPPPSISNGWIDANFRWATGATVNSSSTQIGQRKEYRVFCSFQTTGNTETGHDINGFQEFFPNVSGQVTVGMFTQLHASGITWWINDWNRYQSSFHIMDWDN